MRHEWSNSLAHVCSFSRIRLKTGGLRLCLFFDVERERIRIFWRRVLHTAHHRAQLGVYLRMLDKSVPSIYGPTADVRWEGADPTSSVAAASRK